MESAEDLHEIVGAMRAMAAVRLQEAQAALEGTREYADAVGVALDEVLSLLGPQPRLQCRCPALVLFVPEHGFVGSLAERLVQRARARVGTAAGAGPLIAVGDRGADVAEDGGLALHHRLSLGAHVNAAPAVARRLVAALEPVLEGGRADGVAILYPHYEGGGRAELVERHLLPVAREAAPPGPPPLVNLPVPALAEAVVAEWILGELAHAVVETLASENGVRLRAMDAARTNVESKLDALRGEYRIARQEAITGEIAEVVAGVLAQQ
jgi:F-type H+-transporting ATPase subunit gamma